jgi:hypothetical protein
MIKISSKRLIPGEILPRTGAKSGVYMRVLDRALWQYSKENQPKRTLPLNQAPEDE